MSKADYDIPYFWWRNLMLEHPRVAARVFPEGLPAVFRQEDARRVDLYIESEFVAVADENRVRLSSTAF